MRSIFIFCLTLLLFSSGAFGAKELKGLKKKAKGVKKIDKVVKGAKKSSKSTSNEDDEVVGIFEDDEVVGIEGIEDDEVVGILSASYVDTTIGRKGDPIIYNYILPREVNKCYSTPDVCYTDVDFGWTEALPMPCPPDYEEAAIYTTSEGVNTRFDSNELLREALNVYNGRSFGIQQHCNDPNKPFTFGKVRACVPEGSSCLPNGKFTVNTDVYYNLMTTSNELLSNVDHTSDTQWRKETTEYNSRGQERRIAASMTFNHGPFYPNQEYVFISKDSAWREPKDNAYRERTQWRFIDAGKNEYYLKNRWTGQYMGSTRRNLNNANDYVGLSRLDEEDAMKVSLPDTCSSDGTIVITSPRGTFKKGLANTLYLTAENPDPARTERLRGCYYFGRTPSCNSKEILYQGSICGILGITRSCIYNAPSPNNSHRASLKFFLREVTQHIEPFKSGKIGAKPVPVNTDKDVRTAALDIMAFQLSLEKGTEFFESVYNAYRNAPQKSTYNVLKRSNAVVDLSSILDGTNVGDVARTASFRRQNAQFFDKISSAHSLKSISRRVGKGATDVAETLAPFLGLIGGPGLVLGLGLFSAWQEYETAKQYEERFRAIEQAIVQLAEELDNKFAALCNGALKTKFGDINQETYMAYQTNVGIFRQDAFSNLDTIRDLPDLIATQTTTPAVQWIDNLMFDINRYSSKIGLFTSSQSDCAEDETHADILMDFFPMFAISYIMILQEYFNTEMLMNRIYHPRFDPTFGAPGKEPTTCTQFYDQRKIQIKEMEESARQKRNMVVEYRKNAIKKSDDGSETKTVPWIFDITDKGIPSYSYTTFRFNWDIISDDKVEIFKARPQDAAIRSKVIARRKDEVAWALDNFGKYNMDLMFRAFANIDNSLLDTCQNIYDDEAIRDDYIDVGLVMGVNEMFDESATCNLPSPPLTNVALEKPTSHSTTEEPSYYAVDGVKGESVTTTSSTRQENGPFWQVDLLRDYDIREILVYIDVNNDAVSLRQFEVTIYDRKNVQIWEYKHPAGPVAYRNLITVPATVPLGRLVRVSLPRNDRLKLMEVEVMGREP